MLSCYGLLAVVKKESIGRCKHCEYDQDTRKTQ
jgi:hypothetical protein